MSENLYTFVSSLSTYEDIIDDCNVGDNDVNIKPCKYSIFGEGCDDRSFYRNCLIADKYLNYIKDNIRELNLKVACKYFSYWAYKEMLIHKKYSESVSKLHDNIMKINNVDICKDHVEDITPVIFKYIENLIKLHKAFMEILGGINNFDCDKAEICVDMYKSLEKNCSLDSDDPFCIGLEKFRVAYNETMIPAHKCAQYQNLLPFQEHSEKSSNTIPVVAITAISFASIMTYKFTPLGSWVRYRLSGNKNLRNKLEKEFKASQNSSEHQDMEYRVPYNSS